MATDFGTGSPLNMGLLALGIGIIFLLVLIAIAAYIFMSFAFMRLGKKTNQQNSALAWIPGVGPLIIAFNATKNDVKPWWALLIGFVTALISMIFFVIGGSSNVAMIIIGVVILIAALVFLVYFSVYTYIWNWKLFIAVKKPGWWALIPLFSIPFSMLGIIPFIGIVFTIISYLLSFWYLAMVGIAAWGN